MDRGIRGHKALESESHAATYAQRSSPSLSLSPIPQTDSSKVSQNVIKNIVLTTTF